MKVHYNIEQGSLEWHQMRWAKIGGTRGSGLFVKSDTLAIEVAAEECEEYQDDDSFQNKDMIRGTELEPVARERLEEYTGVKFLQAGWIDSDIRRVGISPDGISEDETKQCEIKCPARKKHTEYCLGGVVPKDHIHQCIHAFLVNPKLERLYFCSFRPEHVKPLFVVELTRESEVDAGLTEKTKVEMDKGKGMKEYVVTVPMIRTVEYWVDSATIAAHGLNKSIDAMLGELEF